MRGLGGNMKTWVENLGNPTVGTSFPITPPHMATTNATLCEVPAGLSTEIFEVLNSKYQQKLASNVHSIV